MVVAARLPAKLTDTRDRLGGAGVQIVPVGNKKLERLLAAALITGNRPAQYTLAAQVRPARRRGPLARRVDQIANLVDHQAHGQIATTLDRADQLVAGLHAAYAVMAAVVHHLRTGQGQHVEVPMFEAFSSFMLKEHLGGNTFDPPVGDACYARQVDPHRQPFPTRDGHVSIVPYRLDHFTKVIALMGDEAFAQEARFATPEGLIAGQAELYARIAELTAGFATDELVALMHANAIPAMPVRDMADMAQEPHLEASGFIMRREHPTEGTLVEMREPSRFSAWDAPDPAPAPLLGEHDRDYREG